MTLTTRTKNIFLVALVLALGATAGAAYLFVRIQEQGALLLSHIVVITESNQKADAHAQTERTVSDTADERAVLGRAFFTEQSDSLNFLTYVEETLGPSAGVAVRTLNISSVPNPSTPGFSQVSIVFRAEGNKDQVVDFVRLLETLPYHSHVGALTLDSGGAGVWVGEATILITVNSV